MTGLLNSLFSFLPLLWEMSLTAAYAAAVVALLRLVLRKRAPKQVLCLLWLVVFARLLVPLSLESPLSIVPDALPGYEQAQSPDKTAVGGNSGALDQSQVSVQGPGQSQAGGGIHQNPAPVLTVPDGVTPTPPPSRHAGSQALLAGVWLAGALAMGLFGLVSYLRLRRRLFDAIRAEDGAWEHPCVGSPFILGVLRPRIYLPAGLAGQTRQFILCHERAHLRRLDHIVKPICWLALAIHWFNPAVWIAFILMSHDMEAACDEAVIRRLGHRVKADYSATLLALATNAHMPAPCPLAFDEGDAKGRIHNVLRYRRPALWMVVVSVTAAVLAAVCLLTDPVSAEKPDASPDPSAAVSASQAPEGLNDLLDPWMLEVLSGERTFTADQKEFNIHQLRTMVYGDGELPKLTLEVGKLAIIDLDQDGINEMVVWPTGESVDSTEVGYYTGYFIFSRQGDTVRVDYPGWRVIGDLKADGTFDWSGSAFDWGTGRARFSNGRFEEVERITWQEGMETKKYFVNGLSATQEEFEAAWAAHQAKPEPTWYVFEDGQLREETPGAADPSPVSSQDVPMADDPVSPSLETTVSAAPELSPSPSPEPSPTPSAALSACDHGLEDIRLEYVGKQLAARCNQCDFTYLVPGVTSAEWHGQTGSADGGGWMREDMDGDGQLEVFVFITDNDYIADIRVVSLDVENGALVTHVYRFQSLIDDFNQNCEYELDFENQIMTVSYQGQTKQAEIDAGYWSYMMNHGGGFAPEIWPTDMWITNFLICGFRVHNGRGLSLGINAIWTITYSAGGGLCPVFTSNW